MSEDLRTDDAQRAATQAAIDYLYRRQGTDEATLYRWLARLAKANGCTNAPDLCFGECCNAHDVAYNTGRDAHGKPIPRPDADRRFLECMAARPESARILAPIYFAAVRVFGEGHYLPNEMKRLRRLHQIAAQHDAGRAQS